MIGSGTGHGTENGMKVTDLIRRARRLSLLRSAMVSLLVSVGVIILLLVTNHLVLDAVSKRIALGEEAAILYTYPNTYSSGGLAERSWGLFGGHVRFTLYRIVGYTPVRLGDRIVTFGWIGVTDRFPSARTAGPILDSEEEVYDSSTLAPCLRFYHPAVEYDSLPIDLARLTGAGKDIVAEVAISLDRPYSVAELQSLLPPGVEARWYAVNIWARREQVPGFALPEGPGGSGAVNHPLLRGIVGFPAFSGLFSFGRDDGTAFLEALRHLARIRGPGQQLLRQAEVYVREHGVRVYGVVVTGKAPDLLQLQGRPWIRAADLGLTASQF